MTPSEKDLEEAQALKKKIRQIEADHHSTHQEILDAILYALAAREARVREEISKLCVIEAMILIPSVSDIVEDRDNEIASLKAMLEENP